MAKANDDSHQALGSEAQASVLSMQPRASSFLRPCSLALSTSFAHCSTALTVQHHVFWIVVVSGWRPERSPGPTAIWPAAAVFPTAAAAWIWTRRLWRAAATATAVHWLSRAAGWNATSSDRLPWWRRKPTADWLSRSAGELSATAATCFYGISATATYRVPAAATDWFPWAAEWYATAAATASSSAAAETATDRYDQQRYCTVFPRIAGASATFIEATTVEVHKDTERAPELHHCARPSQV